MTTIGIKPALPVAIIVAVLTYIAGQELLELPTIAVVAIQAVLIGLGVYQAGPGEVDQAHAVAEFDAQLPDRAETE